MKNINNKLIGFSLILLMFFTSCIGDLEQKPEGGDATTEEELFKDPAAYKQFLAKIYAGLATTGQQGATGKPDVSGIDEGDSQYIRAYYYLQELTTDLSIVSWGDITLQNFHSQTWTPLDSFLNNMFARYAFQVVNCNEFLRQTTDAKLNERGVDESTRAEIAYYRAEARFMRALTYWHLLDAFGGGSLVTENSSTDFNYPEYATRAQLYKFVDDELTAIEPLLKAPRTNEKYRADQAAAWMLHAKLYMNSFVYINEDKYAAAVPYLNNIISSGYTIHNPTNGEGYKQLFLADNDTNGAQNEFIFSIAYDGLYTQNYGGTTFLVQAAVGGGMDVKEFGISGTGWGGLRTTSAFVNIFGTEPIADKRGQFCTNYWKEDDSGIQVPIPRDKEIKDVGAFTEGYVIQKFRNVDVNGKQGRDNGGTFVDCDFPMFRLADVYLMYAECALRGSAGADVATALGYVNTLRSRAKTTTIAQGDLTLDFILDERARELHWECHRRTDLIRFGKFTGGSYVWPWKGGVAGGTSTASYRNIFPIPANALSANNKLVQNPGYN